MLVLFYRPIKISDGLSKLSTIEMHNFKYFDVLDPENYFLCKHR